MGGQRFVQFCFECTEEAFRHRVVITVTLAAHAAGHVVLGQQLLKVVAGILASTIGMVDQITAGTAVQLRVLCWMTDAWRWVIVIRRCLFIGRFDDSSHPAVSLIR